MSQTTAKVVIIGAGPAGISAAAELSKYDIKSTVIDEASKVGGVIYRGPLRQTTSLPHLDEKLKRSLSAIQSRYKKHQHNINLKLNTRVLGPEADNTLLLTHKEKLSTEKYDALLLATGCHERSVPFPGWELPGVMLMGGIQLQLKSNLVRPGSRIALVGTGALLPLVACQMHKAGVNVVGIYEASSFASLAKEAAALMNKPQLTLSGLSMLAYLKRNKVPFHYGWGVVAAKGNDVVQQIEVAPYDENWTADLTRSKKVEVDCLGVGYGFVSRSQLGLLMGLEHEYLPISGLTPVTSTLQSSNSHEGIYVAGDGAGLLGADAAMYEGQLAALGIAKQLGVVSAQQVAKRSHSINKNLKRIQRFREGFDRFSTRQIGLLDLPAADTIVCRCENVTRAQVDKALDEGVRDMASLKMRTRVCMGDCQGKTCASYCYDRLKALGLQQEMGIVRPRFPLDPIPFAALED
jgi:hydrogen cyanide synthase HcnB